MRNLVSIQVIDKLDPIEGADSIERAQILGWGVVVKKDEFKVGDTCVFFEIDSILPKEATWAKFMEARNFRVKTVKLRGCLSQGLALPISILPDRSTNYELGEDVTDALGVVKYEPEIHASISNVAKGNFPPDVPKTDETRLQGIVKILDELKTVPFVATVKLDGTSATYIKRSDELQVCSRNLMLKQSDSAYWKLAEKYDLANKLPEGFAVQGEICGPGIQKNKLGLKEADFFVFNIYEIDVGHYLSHHEIVEFCYKWGLKTVPTVFIVDESGLGSFEFTLENFLEKARGFYDGTKNRREGIVVRSLWERRSKTLRGARFSFKVINNDFLLKDED